MKISSSSCTGSPPADRVVVLPLFGCGGETNGVGALFLVAGGDEMELSGGSLSKSDGVGVGFVFLACPHPIEVGLRFLTLGQHVGML